ncbi:MAG TPA: GNAT family N-acetyltransferase [Beijerinckiaceae bacterium]|nr:GNAT family N-acetyltransferase [Beijerinckiaceae bacterium]
MPLPSPLPASPAAQRAQTGPAARPEQRRAKGGRALGRIEVHENLDSVDSAWKELEDLCPASVYQTRRWLAPWMETLGGACNAIPMLVVAYGKSDMPVAFLPLAVVAYDRIKIAGFLGGRDSNANCGLFRPGVSFSRGDLESIFRAAALKARQRPDVFTLSHQPESWEGLRNPLLAIPHLPSASAGHCTRLASDPAAYVRSKLSPDSHKKLLKKRRRLEKDFGPLCHVKASGKAEALRVLDAFFAQKLARFRQQGIESDFSHPSTKAFLERASASETGEPVLELHALIAGDRIVATYGGALHRGRFHAMINSFDSSPAVAKTSPGDLLLLAMLEDMCAAGIESFDLGVGEARYKDVWCELTEPLFETLVPVTAKGRAFALAESARLRVKRQVKQSPWLWSLAQQLRTRL